MIKNTVSPVVNHTRSTGDCLFVCNTQPKGSDVIHHQHRHPPINPPAWSFTRRECYSNHHARNKPPRATPGALNLTITGDGKLDSTGN